MHRIDDFADIADAGVTGGVHFHHVDVAALHDGCAMLADAAGFGRWATCSIRTDAVHPLGDDACRRGFASAADARHHKGLGNAVRLKRVFQRADHRILAHQINKGLGPVFAGQNLISGGSVSHEGPCRIGMPDGTQDSRI